MVKKIFISQSSLELGRNREKRRLEATLDCPQVNSSKGKPLFRPPVDICIYNSHCNVRKVLGRKQCYLEFTKSCRTYQYYQRYGR